MKTSKHSKTGKQRNTEFFYQNKETPKNIKTSKQRNTEILISSCWTLDIRLFDFYRKRGLGPDQIHYNHSLLWSRLHTTLAQITRTTPKWIYTEWTVSIMFSTFKIFEQLVLPLKNRVCLEIFHCIEYTFYIPDFWETCACNEKQSCLKFSLSSNTFYHSGILSNLRLPWKTVCPEFTVLNIYFLSFWIFEQLMFALKNRIAWKSSLYWNIFVIQEFWVTCACPENRACPEFFQARGAAAPHLVRLWWGLFHVLVSSWVGTSTTAWEKGFSKVPCEC